MGVIIAFRLLMRRLWITVVLAAFGCVLPSVWGRCEIAVPARRRLRAVSLIKSNGK
ncbi:MAG TPA: hypothetical protein VHZ96_20115 [Frankiaceae bacterium]|jgi:hypothetical protein|nr:hypothetical protein [Frankiaceae bacterium]